ncbi:hypothetical protein HDU67_003461, partial [Dinochytrium kinnereticum]
MVAGVVWPPPAKQDQHEASLSISVKPRAASTVDGGEDGRQGSSASFALDVVRQETQASPNVAHDPLLELPSSPALPSSSSSSSSFITLDDPLAPLVAPPRHSSKVSSPAAFRKTPGVLPTEQYTEVITTPTVEEELEDAVEEVGTVLDHRVEKVDDQLAEKHTGESVAEMNATAVPHALPIPPIPLPSLPATDPMPTPTTATTRAPQPAVHNAFKDLDNLLDELDGCIKSFEGGTPPQPHTSTSERMSVGSSSQTFPGLTRRSMESILTSPIGAPPNMPLPPTPPQANTGRPRAASVTSTQSSLTRMGKLPPPPPSMMKPTGNEPIFDAYPAASSSSIVSQDAPSLFAQQMAQQNFQAGYGQHPIGPSEVIGMGQYGQQDPTAVAMMMARMEVQQQMQQQQQQYFVDNSVSGWESSSVTGGGAPGLSRSLSAPAPGTLVSMKPLPPISQTPPAGPSTTPSNRHSIQSIDSLSSLDSTISGKKKRTVPSKAFKLMGLPNDTDLSRPAPKTQPEEQIDEYFVPSKLGMLPTLQELGQFIY